MLCDVRYEVGEKARIEFLDRVMRMGVFMGYHHASEHPAIVQLLLERTRILVEKMGIHAVKHLKVCHVISSHVISVSSFVSRYGMREEVY